MKRHLSILLLFLPLLFTAQTVIQITSNITSDMRWTADNIYELSGTNFIYVTNNATLTIDPGTIVRGNPAALVITRSCKIMAVGTLEQPIVMTSAKPAGQRQAGDWGGLLILGNAKINNPAGETVVEGGIDPVLGKYGGQDDADNSGILRYVRIEFAGIAFQPNNETNGLTLGGVGNGTEITYVQVSHGGDDGFEWFGGTVNGKHLVVNKILDDMFDTDFGYTGTNQFLIGISDPAIADISNSNGFEADNDAQGTLNQPISQSVFTNATIIGPRIDSSTSINSLYRRGFHLRRSTRQSIRNSIISGFPIAARVESANSENSFLTTLEMKIRNNIFTGFTTYMDSTSANSPIIRDSLLAINRSLPYIANVMLANPAASTPNLLPNTGSPALTGANFSNMPAFAQTTTYVGAMGTSDWTKCWCEWDANNADYSKGLNYVAEVTDFTFVVDKNGVQFNTLNIAGASYRWDFGDFTNSTQQNPQHTYSALGVFKVVLTVTTARGCSKSIIKNVQITEGTTEIAVNIDISSDTKWTSNNIYNLTGAPFIYVKNNAVLTIEPGTIIKGSPAALVITRGSKIYAIGEVDKPIVFTSAKPAGSRVPGDWGGLLLLGKARINNPAGETVVEGGIDPTLGKYGGTDDDDNSGILKYVRIEFAGIAFQPNNETNSLTCGGVGTQTIIEHVQTSFGGDDAFEWFGGTVNGKFLLAYKTVDDMFDTDFGYRGKNQYLFGVSDPNLADISNSNGFEADNDATGTTNQPQSQAVFSNVTLIGPRKDASSTFNSNFRRSIHLRRSTKQSVTNSILSGFPIGIRLESANCENYYLNTKEINLSHNILSNNGKLFDSTSVQTKTVSDLFITENRMFNAVDDVMMTDPYGAKPVATLKAGSPALTGSDFTNLDVFFDRTTHVGAFGATDWSDCWAEYDPVNADYSFAPLHYFKEDIDFTSSTSNNLTSFVPNITGNYTYSWDFGDGSPADNSVNPSHRYNATGSYNVKLHITNSRGCVKTVEQSINVTIVSTQQSEYISKFEVYPNPNSGSFIVHIASKKNMNSKISISDGLGKIVHVEDIILRTGENLVPINPSMDLAKGYYSLRIMAADGIITKLVLVL